MATVETASGSPGWLVGGGELGELIRAHDWAATPLGAVEGWPQSLRSAVSILLPSRAQICLFWGPELIAIYNDAYRPVLGMKHPRSLGVPCREMWPELWGPFLRELFEGVMRTGEAFWASDRPFFLERHGYPEETYFDVSYDPVRDESGRVGGVFCIVAETTGRVVGERRLRTLSGLGRVAMQARAMPEVFEGAAAMLAAATEDLPFVLLYEWDADRGAARLRASAGIEASHPAAAAEVFAGEAATWPVAADMPEEGRVVEGGALAHLGVLPGGPWPEPCARVSVLPIALPSQPPEGFMVAGASPRRPYDAAYRDYLRLVAAGIASALANTKALEAQRRRAEALAELDRAKTMFFSNVSHEFRTPLTLLLGPLEEELSGRELPPATRARLETSHRNALRLLKLVNTLLDFSRIEAGRLGARFEATDLASLTSELASSFRSACERAGLSLRVDCEPLPQPVFVDRDLWEKIVLNLLSNAFKFTLRGGLEVWLRAEGGRAVLAVRDTGEGIAPAELPRIFERFHRVEGARSRSHEGSGIGLALVQELVRLHGGEIRVDSRLGEGSVFEVALPFGDAHLPREQVVEAGAEARPAGQVPLFVEEAMGWLGEAPRAPSPPPARGEAPRARVLVVDDNADMRAYLERLLSEHWDVVTAPDGEAALHVLLTARIDAVLTDVMMPKLDGFGLLQAIRSEAALRELPVLMLSARAGEEARIEGHEAGADGYLVKPFGARELVAQVRAHLALARARRMVAREREVLLANERAARMDSQRRWEDIVCLFEQAPNPMVILRGPEHAVELANPAACTAWGRTLEQVLHRPLFEAIPEAAGQGLEPMLAGVLASGRACARRRYPVRLQRNDKVETVLFDFAYSPLRGASGRVDAIAVIAFEVGEAEASGERAGTRETA